MPWWGWLIACGVVFVGLIWLTVAVLATRTVRSVNRDMKDEFDRWGQEHGFGRR